MEETLRVLVCLGFALLLVMLRLDAERFGVAEYLDEAVGSAFGILRRRLSWYVLGLSYGAAILVVHPDASGALGLHAGDGGAVLLAGLGAGIVGVLQAAGVALARSRRLSLPAPEDYPWGIVNATATAFIDEITFRGVILGFLLLAGLDAPPAILIQALLYALATRTGARGRDPYLVVLALGIGLVGGWLTIATGGIGAAFLAHAVTRFAVFAFLGGDGPTGEESTGSESPVARGPQARPDGWQAVGRRGPGAESA